MRARVTAYRLLQIALSRSAGGRRLPAAIQLVLIIAWHPLMILAVSAVPFDDLQERSSYFWFRIGITSSYISNIETIPRTHERWHDAVLAVAVPTTVFVLVEGLLGWLVYRVVNRRPRPRWYRFVRFWWRTCLYGTLVVPVVATVLALLPFWVANLGQVSLALCFCAGPAWFARREILRRGRRLGKLCPVCRYCLRGITADICPECGTPLTHDAQRGHVVDQARLRAITKRQRRPWVRVAKVCALLLIGAGAGRVGQSLYERHVKYRLTEPTLVLPTAQGYVEYQTCLRCNSVRITLPDGTVEHPVQTDEFNECSHHWDASFAAWSAFKLSPGDVLLIRKGGHYNAAKILSASRNGTSIQFEWFHQPKRTSGTFVDACVERGQKRAAGKITFKNVDLRYGAGSIWYDYYYGGVRAATQNTADPHYIAYAGKVDIAGIDAADPGWIYKAWEDGNPNGYEEDSTRIDLRLTAEDEPTLEFIWKQLSPNLSPRDDEELARFRLILATHVYATSAPGVFSPIWPAIRDDFQAGGRPGSSSIWDNLVGYRTAEVSTQGLGRVRGVVVPVFRTLGQDSFLAIQSDEGGEQVMLADIALLRLGDTTVVQAEGNEVPRTTVPVRVRTHAGEIVTGVVTFREDMQSGLDFWLHPFRRLGSVPEEYGGSIHLTTKIDQPSAIPLMRYDWITFGDASARVCPKCGTPAESLDWIVCPFDGTTYE